MYMNMDSRFNEGLPTVLAFLVVLGIVCFAIWALIFWRTPADQMDQNSTTPTPTIAVSPTPTLEPTATPSVTPEPTGDLPSPTPTVVANETVTPTTAEVREVVVRAFEYAFDPGVIQVNAGETIQIRFENTGTMAHNFTIEDLGIASGNVEPGESTVFQVKIPVNDKSEYSYYCSQSNHRALGMEGRISVVQP